MNERYLYRGKSLDNHGSEIKKGDWVIGGFVENHHAMDSDVAPSIYYTGGGFYFVKIDPDTVGQCTGRSDKNGKLIFEGDFIENFTDIFEIKYCQTEAAFRKYLKLEKYKIKGFYRKTSGSVPFFGEDPKKLKIISNIYDDPELIERIYYEFCHPGICEHCIVIGKGIGWCDIRNKTVRKDRLPTIDFMGEACPYVKKRF